MKKKKQQKEPSVSEKIKKYLDEHDLTQEELDQLLVYFNDLLMVGLKRDVLKGEFEEGFDEDSSLDRLERGKKFKEEMKKGGLSQEEMEKYLSR